MLSAQDLGIDSLGINPAGSVGAKRPELLSTFTSGILDDAYGFIGYVHPSTHGVISASVSYYDAGSVDLVGPTGTIQNVSAERDYIGSLGWAMPVFGGITIGGLARYYHLNLAQTASASGYSADLGAQWATPIRGLRLGAALQNIGPAVKFESASDPLPLTTRAGAAWTIGTESNSESVTLTSTMLTLGADAIQTRGDSAAAGTAAEFTLGFGPTMAVSLRSGYVFNYAGGLSFGVGIREGRFSADYAVAYKRDLGNAQDLSLRVRF